MNILFLGAPGCGKGTQSKILIEKHGIPQISTGDLLREEIKAGSNLGKELQDIMSSGKFVSDELVLSLVSKKIMQDECKKGFILDGYPRNISQAKSLDSLFLEKNIKLEYVFLIDVPFDNLIKRCTGRLLCTTCDYIGNMDKGEKVGDKCENGELYQREDDGGTVFGYHASSDLAQGTGFQTLCEGLGADNDHSLTGYHQLCFL